MKWYRVNKKRRCKICGRADWCGYLEDVSICMRVESAEPTRNGGWLHRAGPIPLNSPARLLPIGNKVARPVRSTVAEKLRPIGLIPSSESQARELAPPDLKSLWQRWSTASDFRMVDGLAMTLGVEIESLNAIGCVWNGQAWGFPMKDEKGELIGIRLRSTTGQKWAVKGSRQGLFIPELERRTTTLFIVEGPTDLAASLTLGLAAIGRPSCLGCEVMITDYIRNTHVRRVVIVSDNDEAGLRGAAKLQKFLPVLSSVWTPPTNDIREFLNAGGKRVLIESCINDLVWTRPTRTAAA
jgi:hypothetical protein